MILGVMSDTHGNSRLIHSVVDAMQSRFGVDVIFHLGDDYHDVDDLIAEGLAVRRVPGLWCPEYQDSRIPKRLVENFDGIAVACAHADRDLRHTERAAAIILTGHTHRAQIALLGRSLYVNPGHMKVPVSGNQHASYAVIEIRPDEVHAGIHDAMTHKILDESTVSCSRLA
jgi:putative phosphoesterase